MSNGDTFFIDEQPPPRRKPQPQPGQGGHVDANPSPVMGSASPDDVPFLANPTRMLPQSGETGGRVDSNPSPDFSGERNHQSWLLNDDPGVADENNPNYRLVKSEPNAPQGANALIEHYIEQAITAVSNGDKVTAAQMAGAAKTLISMVIVQAKKGNNPTAGIQKMEAYNATVAKIEASV